MLDLTSRPRKLTWSSRQEVGLARALGSPPSEFRPNRLHSPGARPDSTASGGPVGDDSPSVSLCHRDAGPARRLVRPGPAGGPAPAGPADGTHLQVRRGPDSPRRHRRRQGRLSGGRPGSEDFEVKVGGKVRPVVTSRFLSLQPESPRGTSLASTRDFSGNDGGTVGRLFVLAVDHESLPSGAGRPLMTEAAKLLQRLGPQ